MPNPYHDADGKFCSRDGMRESIQNLIKDNRVDDALKLTGELKALDDAAAKGKDESAFVADLTTKKAEPSPEEKKEELFNNFYWSNASDGPGEFVKLLEDTGAKTSPEDAANLSLGLDEIRRDAYSNGVAVEMNGASVEKPDFVQLTDNLLAQLESGGQIDFRAKLALEDVVEKTWDGGYNDGGWDT